jgi:FkbH-like protein
MYETEINSVIESSSQIPPEVLGRFRELESQVVSRTLLPWSEHCTECVWPTCYTTCDLYKPRADRRCRRFVDGMVRIDCPGSVNSYLLKIRFKRWGKLWAPGTLRFYPAARAKKFEARDYRIGKTLQRLPLPAPLKRSAVVGRYRLKKTLAQRALIEENLDGSFLLECYNPQESVIPLSITVRSLDAQSRIPFQNLIQVPPGFLRARIPVSEISSVIDMRSPFSIELIPNDISDGTTLYFGIVDFVCERQVVKEERTAKVKCVVWDLDNTLWNGILTEDGPDKLTLKPGVGDVIRELDRRGILHSVVSKNNPEEAMRVLNRFNLSEYFLYPQISWQPKSNGVAAIAKLLNVGLDTLLFVDDSEFELQEVATVHPQVRILRAEQYLALVEMPELQVPVTAEAANRRRMYQVEADRKSAAEGFGSDYQAFLRDCNIGLNVKPLSPENLDRVHELTQRTNQMNFSGNRYSREVLTRILSTPYLDTYVIDCEDRFGSYGVVGFSIVDRREPRMTDLMFSCRIQAKRVEHAFLAFLIRKYIAQSGKDFLADYRKTPRNEPSGRVFADLGMQAHTERDGVSLLVFPKERPVPEDGVIDVRVHEDVGVGV